MEQPESPEPYNQSYTTSKPFNDANVIKIRLDCEPVLTRIEYYLRGIRETVKYDEQGMPVNDWVQVSRPKMNEEGVADIINWLAITINPQTVQGNFPSDRSPQKFSQAYETYIYEYNLALINEVIVKRTDWEMKEEDMCPVIDQIMLLVQPFFSRLLDNEERRSYGESMTASETQTTMPQKSPFNIFGRK
jgi:hypothetical protein